MGKTVTVKPSVQARKSRPALTPEARENQLIAAAYDLAEKQIMEGTASSQVLTHFLKQGTVKAQIELEKLRRETELIKAKEEALQSAKQTQVLLEDAMKAFRMYNGYNTEEEVDG